MGSWADLELLHELNVRLDARQTQLSSPRQSHKYSLATNSHSLTALHSRQSVYYLIDPHFGQNHDYLNAYDSHPAALVYEEESWASVIESYPYYLLDL